LDSDWTLCFWVRVNAATSLTNAGTLYAGQRSLFSLAPAAPASSDRNFVTMPFRGSPEDRLKAEGSAGVYAGTRGEFTAAGTSYSVTGAPGPHGASTPGWKYTTTEWWHYALSGTAATVSEYINGKLRGSISVNGVFTASTPQGIFGAHDARYRVDAALRDIRIYRAALTPSELHVLGRWACNNGLVTTVTAQVDYPKTATTAQGTGTAAGTVDTYTDGAFSVRMKSSHPYHGVTLGMYRLFDYVLTGVGACYPGSNLFASTPFALSGTTSFFKGLTGVVLTIDLGRVITVARMGLVPCSSSDFSNQDFTNAAPSFFRIYGSRTNADWSSTTSETWMLIHTQSSSLPYTQAQETIFDILNPSAYQIYTLVVTNLRACGATITSCYSNFMTIQAWNIYATESSCTACATGFTAQAGTMSTAQCVAICAANAAVCNHPCVQRGLHRSRKRVHRLPRGLVQGAARGRGVRPVPRALDVARAVLRSKAVPLRRGLQQARHAQRAVRRKHVPRVCLPDRDKKQTDALIDIQMHCVVYRVYNQLGRKLDGLAFQSYNFRVFDVHEHRQHSSELCRRTI